MCYRNGDGEVLVSKKEKRVLKRKDQLERVAGPSATEEVAKEEGISINTVRHHGGSVLEEGLSLNTGVDIFTTPKPYSKIFSIIDLYNRTQVSG